MCHRSWGDPGRIEKHWKVKFQHFQEVRVSPCELDENRARCIPPGAHGLQYSLDYATEI